MDWLFWLELIARSSALLLSAEAIRRWSRSQPAAFRHKLLLWVVLLLGLLPVLFVVLPAIHVPAWTYPRHDRTATVIAREVAATPLESSAQHHTNWAFLIWLAGVLTTSAPILVGAVSVARIARRAKPLSAASPLSPAEILVSDEVSAPITCGLWRSRILLPAAARTWSSTRLQAVLSHELAHIRRHDVAAQIGAHLVAALWWFQPLAWLLRRHLRAESELACDAEALRSGLRPSAYAAELLAVARALRRQTHLISSCGISMAHGSDLEQRVRLILKPGSVRVSLPNRIIPAVLLGTIAVAASALTLSSSQSFSEQGGSTMKRTLMSGLLTSVGLSAATVTGAVHDPSGSAIANATVEVVNPDTGSKQETVTDSEGKFSLSGASAGQYILKIEKPGFAPILREFDLKAESNMDRQLTMSTETGSAGPEDLVTNSETSSKPVSVGGEFAQSKLIKRVQPVYPSAAKSAGTQGVVQIKTTISKDGVPVDLQIISSPSSDLAESALEAVRQWRYRPTLLNGDPVGITTTVIVHYTLGP